MEDSKMSLFNDIVFKEFNMNNTKIGKENDEEDFASIRKQGNLFRTNIDLLNCFDDEDHEDKKPNHSNEPNGMESNDNIKNSKNLSGKGTIFEKSENDSKKQKKLLMNRISAKKSRQKKKEYVTYLENEIERLKKEKNNIKKYQNANNKSNINNQINGNSNNVNNMNKKNIDLDFLIKKQLELTELQIKSKVNNEKDEIEYTKVQKRVLHGLFINHIKYLMPLKLKIFQQKYLKMEPFLESDTLEDLIFKINVNIDTLNALYDFSKNEQKDCISMQFMSYYTQLKKYVLNFKENYDLL